MYYVNFKFPNQFMKNLSIEGKESKRWNEVLSASTIGHHKYLFADRVTWIYSFGFLMIVIERFP